MDVPKERTSTTRSSTPPPTSRRASRSPASARARCRCRCSCRASARSVCTARRSRATSPAGSGTPPRSTRIALSTQPELDYELPASRQHRLELHGDGVRAAEAGRRRLDEARGSLRRAGGSGGPRRPRAERPAFDGCRAGARRGPARSARATRSSSIWSPATAASATTSSSSATGRLVPELEEQLVGMSAGETKEIELDRPGEEEPAQVEAVDQGDQGEGAAASSTTSSRAPPRSSTRSRSCAPTIEQRLREQVEAEVDEAFRRATLDRLVEASKVAGLRPARRGAHAHAAARARRASCSAAARRSTRICRCPASRRRTSSSACASRRPPRSPASSCSRRSRTSSGSRSRDEEVDETFRDRFDEPEKVIEQARAAGAYETERENMRLARALDRVVGRGRSGFRRSRQRPARRIWTPEKEKHNREAETVDPRQQGASPTVTPLAVSPSGRMGSPRRPSEMTSRYVRSSEERQ